MDTKLLVKISNIIGLTSILLLIYWVFTFSLINIFGLKIFRQHLTESFFMSILGILALMAGALMLNIMLNLTRIAERGSEPLINKTPKKTIFTCLIIFPIIACILFGGNYLTTQKKQDILVQSAENMIRSEKNRFQQLVNYQFDEPYIMKTTQDLDFLAVLDSAFTDVQVIVPDTIQGNQVYLNFSRYPRTLSDSESDDPVVIATQAANEVNMNAPSKEKQKISLDKKKYVKQLSLAEKEYLKSVFEQKNKAIKFEAEDGYYQLYYPYTDKGKTIVLYFSDRQRYGKLGS